MFLELSLEAWTWIGIAFCISQSATFSGLNLAVFSIPRLTLEIDAARGVKAAQKILHMREDSNFLLATILWGNVGINVLLTLLSDSVLAGVSAFLFSTVAITIVGEIGPQAYFSRHAVRMAALLSPVLRMYQFLLYPVAKPIAVLLDSWLGKEGIQYFRERQLKEMIRHHVEAEEAVDLDMVEGLGAMNFLSIDDVKALREGESVDPESIIALPVRVDLPIFPTFEQNADDPFMKQINQSKHKWVILAGPEQDPLLVLDADGFLRAALFAKEKPVDPYLYCHRPIVINNPHEPLGEVIWKLKALTQVPDDEVIDKDVILVWSESHKRVITGADLLGRLLQGMGHEKEAPKENTDEALPPEAVS